MGERQLLFLMNAEQARAFAELVQAANGGDGHAACQLGDMCREGLGGLVQPQGGTPLVRAERHGG